MAASTTTSVSASATAVTLKAANNSRLGLTVFNDSSAALYIKEGAGASTSDFKVKLAAGDYWEMEEPIYFGLVSGIWESATGAARITEKD